MALFLFEHHRQPLIPFRRFVVRLVTSAGVAFTVVIVSLGIGMLGFRWIERFSWIDSFLNAAMLVGGMGPVTTPVTPAGKLFAGLYGMYCGFVVLILAGLLLAPLAHRLLHKFHVEGDK